MFYRILKAPPGYPPEQQYLVAAYETLAYDSSKFVTKDDGSKFMATLEDARSILPKNAVRLPFEQENQFLELWQD